MSDIELNQVNCFCLRKQHLTDESKIDDIIQIVNEIGGLHATIPKTPYLSLFARTKNFAKESLDDELYVKRNLGKIRCMRKTIYIQTKEMIPVVYSATKNIVEIASERYAEYLGITREEYNELSKLVLEILKGRGMTTSEIKKALHTKLNVSAVLNLMCDQGLLIRGIPKKGWKSNIHTYYLLNEYFLDMNLNELNKANARELMVKHYLDSFGPVTVNDAAWWAGFPKGEVKQILEGLCDQTNKIEILDMKGSYLITDLDLKHLQSLKPKEKNTVNLLPALDSYLMGYKERERYLSPKYYSKVFDRSGNATSTILLDGKVIGVWDIAEKPKTLIKLYLFKEVKKRILKEIHINAKKTGKFITDKEVQIKECDSMIPLNERTAGGFMSPLKDC